MGLSFLYMRVNASVFQYRVDFDFKVNFFSEWKQRQGNINVVMTPLSRSKDNYSKIARRLSIGLLTIL